MQRIRLSIGTVILTGLTILSLAFMTAAWWANRQTLFNTGQWVIGKNTGKYVFYTFDFMFQNLDRNGLDLTRFQGFHEILYAHPESFNRRLTGVECDVRISSRAYLWILLRKSGQRLMGCRLSRNADYPSGFYSYDAQGRLLLTEPIQTPLPYTSGANRLALRLENGSLHVALNGREIAVTTLAGPPEGYFGFKGSGWDRCPVVIRNAVFHFSDPARPGRNWSEEAQVSSGLRLDGRAWMPALLFALILVGLRILRQRFLLTWIPAERHAVYRIGDSGLFFLILTAAWAGRYFLFPGGSFPILILLTLAMSEIASLILFTGLKSKPEIDPPIPWTITGVCHGIILAALFGTVMARHGPGILRWSPLPFRSTMETLYRDAIAIFPGIPSATAPGQWEQITAAPGQPFFTGAPGFRDQQLSAWVRIPSNSTLDIVLQQQSLRTLGDLQGETIPLHRRLIRLSTRADVATGLSRPIGHWPQPFLPIGGTVVPGQTNTLEILCRGNELQIKVNGIHNVFHNIPRLEFGETGFMAYEQPVVLTRVSIKPLAPILEWRRLDPWLGALLPFLAGYLMWLILRGKVRLPLAGIMQLEFIALAPPAVYAAGALFLERSRLIALDGDRLVFMTFAFAVWAILHFYLLLVFHRKVRRAVLHANLFMVAAIAWIAIGLWNLLPQAHPWRMKLAPEVIVPGPLDAGPADAPGPWYNSNRKIGSGPYFWKQQFGGRSVAMAKPEGTLRAFVVGGSQAWGAGAADSSHTFVRLLEDQLKAQGVSIEIFNAAMNGGGIRQAQILYREVLRPFTPDFLIAVVGLNECSGLTLIRNPDKRAAQIRQVGGFFDDLLRDCAADGVRLILVLEPMCAETPLRPIRELYDVLDEKTRAAGGRVIKPAEAMAREEKTHFIWWDTAHFTPRGHQLMADCIAPVMEVCVKNRRRRSDEIGAGE